MKIKHKIKQDGNLTKIKFFLINNLCLKDLLIKESYCNYFEYNNHITEMSDIIKSVINKFDTVFDGMPMDNTERISNDIIKHLIFSKRYGNMFMAHGTYEDYYLEIDTAYYSYEKEVLNGYSEKFQKEFYKIVSESLKRENGIMSLRDISNSSMISNIIECFKLYKPNTDNGEIALPFDWNFYDVLNKDIYYFLPNYENKEDFERFLFVYSPRTVTLIEI